MKDKPATRSNVKDKPVTTSQSDTASNVKDKPATRSNVKDKPATRSNVKDKHATTSQSDTASNVKDKPATRSNVKDKPATTSQSVAASNVKDKPATRSNVKDKPATRSKSDTASNVKDKPADRSKSDAASNVKDNPADRSQSDTASNVKDNPADRSQSDTASNVKDMIRKFERELLTYKRPTFFKSVQFELSGLEFETIKEVALELLPKIEEKYPILVENALLNSSKYKVCERSIKLLPSDVQGDNILPYANYGDGNCLYKAASMICFGTEKLHVELRVRTCLENAAFDYLYTNPTFLADCKHLKIRNLHRLYSSFSHFAGGDIISVYQVEVRNNIFNFQFSGAWQIHALGEVIGVCMKIIYPEYGGHTVRKHLHGVISPRRNMGVSTFKYYKPYFQLLDSNFLMALYLFHVTCVHKSLQIKILSILNI